jgi:PAS domain-containing protein
MKTAEGRQKKTISPVALSRQRWLRRLTIVFSFSLLHGILFLPLFFFWGPIVAFIIIIPIGLSGWFFGTRVGILSALAGFFYSGFLYNLTGNLILSRDMLAWSVIFLGVCVLAGAIAGLSRNTFRQPGILNGLTLPDDTPAQQYLYEASVTSCISALPDAAFAIDLDGHIVAWNSLLATLSSILPEQALGKSTSTLTGEIFGSRPTLLVEYLLRPSPQMSIDFPRCEHDGLSLEVEYFIPQEHGSGQYLWVKASPLYDLDRNIIGGLQIIRDVTQLRLEQEPNTMLLQRDKLTGLYSLSYFNEEMTRLDKSDLFPISVLIISLDLQSIRKTAPDVAVEEDAIHRIAGAIRSSFRTSDAAAYLGEGSFGVVLTKADAVALQKASIRLQAALDKRIPNPQESGMQVQLATATSLSNGTLGVALQQCKQNLNRESS